MTQFETEGVDGFSAASYQAVTNGSSSSIQISRGDREDISYLTDPISSHLSHCAKLIHTSSISNTPAGSTSSK